MRHTIATINLAAIAGNHNLIKNTHPQAKILSVIKADAYGHGATQVAHCLKDITDGFAVACLEEALELRAAGINNKILLLSGFHSPDELELIATHNLDIAVHCREQTQVLLKTPYLHLNLWLKHNTAMNRLGFNDAELIPNYQQLAGSGYQTIHLMTHLAQADTPDAPLNQLQQHNFTALQQTLAGLGIRHTSSMANSAHILTSNQPILEWIRPGLMLYGAATVNNYLTQKLQPAMTFSSKIIAIREVQPQQSVGYGNIWTASKKTIVAIVACGYADGYPATAKIGTPVLIGNHLAKLIGRPCMDMLMLDISHIPDIKIGDKVILWGQGLPIETIAKAAGTIPYVLMTSLRRNRTQLHYSA